MRAPAKIITATAGALAFSLLVMGCSSDGKSSTSETTAVPGEVPRDQAAATRAGLKASDLSGEWTVETQPAGSLSGLFDLTPDCAALKKALSGEASDRTASAPIRLFTSDRDEVVTSGVTVYADATGAEAFMTALDSGDAAECMSSIIALRDEVETNVAEEALDVGDDAYALTVTSEGVTETPSVTRFIWVRSGRAVAAFNFASFPQSPLPETPQIEAVLDRMATFG